MVLKTIHKKKIMHLDLNDYKILSVVLKLTAMENW